MTRYLHGIHDIGAEYLHANKPGWTLVAEEVGLNTQIRGKDYTAISNLGIGVIVRLSHGYGSTGTIPLPHEYPKFAAACQAYAATCQGVAYFMIGNEPNLAGERPQGVMILPRDYNQCFDLCYSAIRNAVPSAKIMPAAMAPYNIDSGDWLDYATDVYAYIADHTGCDAVNIHAYTRGMNPADITSQAKMGEPLQDQFSGFLTFMDVLENAIPPSLAHLPAFISEFDAYHDWEDQNTGVIKAAYSLINDWNKLSGTQKIAGMLCFRWLGKPEVENTFDWEMRNKPQLLQDFAQTVDAGYLSPTAPATAPQPDDSHTVFIPGVSTGGDSMPAPIERDIDPRLYERGVSILDVQPSDPNALVWKVVKGRYYNEEESQGRHHLYVESLDENGNLISGMGFTADGQGSDTPGTTNGKSGFDAANVPMWASEGKNGYKLVVPNGDQVIGIGMGEETSSGFNAGVHTSQSYTYQIKRGSAVSQPSQPTQPPPTTQPSTVPPLTHPVADPQFRRITQGFGARPEYYRQYTIDGVPLKGHEGLDFGALTGTKVVAVDGGKVTEVGNQGDKGYGRWIKIVHSWGETVYAHLEEQWVKVGDMVGKGTVIGITGYTGNVDPKGEAGAHLHFGLRVNPFNRKDGWGGYRDPLPYLASTGTGPMPAPEPSQSKSELLQLTRQAAREFGIPYNLLVSLVMGESSYNPKAHNSESGAMGLGQITHPTWNEWSKKFGATDPFNPRDNLRVTAAYLDWCIDLVGGNVRKGLWCYNWSPRDVPKGLTPPPATIEFASKVLHGKDVLDLVENQ